MEVITKLIPDQNLEDAVRDKLQKFDGEITVEDLHKMTSSLNGIGKQISDLTGLEHCTSLTELFFADNQISDLTPLTDLKNLTTIGMSYNKISDLSPLANLTNLSKLILERNSISDVSPLQNLINLKTLILDNNEITDITPLVNNQGLGYNEEESAGDHVHLAKNTLDLTEGSKAYNDIQKMIDRGVQVVW